MVTELISMLPESHICVNVRERPAAFPLFPHPLSRQPHGLSSSRELAYWFCFSSAFKALRSTNEFTYRPPPTQAEGQSRRRGIILPIARFFGHSDQPLRSIRATESRKV